MSSGNEACLDVTGIESSKALHTAIAAAFNFPDYYGKNWDAFDECLSDSGLQKIQITGIAALIDICPRDAGLLEKCLKDYGRETGAVISIK